MTKKNVPYLFLLILIIVLIFIGGVKYGQKVEEANKTIKYILSITPTKPAPTLAPTKPISYQTFTDDYCGIKLLYPSNLTPVYYYGVGQSIKFVEDKSAITDKTTHLRIDCDVPNGFFIFTERAASESATLNKEKITRYEKNNSYGFEYENKSKQIKIAIIVSKELYPLLEASLEKITPGPTKPATSPTKNPTIKSIISP